MNTPVIVDAFRNFALRFLHRDSASAGENARRQRDDIGLVDWTCDDGDEIRHRRIGAGLSLDQLAGSASMTADDVMWIEYAIRAPSQHEMQRLDHALHAAERTP